MSKRQRVAQQTRQPSLARPSALGVKGLLSAVPPIVVAGTLLALAVVPGTANAAGPGEAIELLVLSNRADLVSGGDALVEIRGSESANLDDLTVTLDGADVTEHFSRRANGRYLGLLSALEQGDNDLVAVLPDGSGARLTITNHPIQGPIFAGKQAEPYVCATQEFGLGPPTGPGCAAQEGVAFFYKSTVTGQFETYDPDDPPAGALVATTTTDEDTTVPYIVRRERGVINRGIYDIAVLFDPGSAWEPWDPQEVWNGKFHWIFRGACDAWHRQHGPVDVFNHPSESPLGDLPLSRGFAVATSALNNCNDLLAAETLMMVKEHFIENYGEIRYTTSIGCSGGSAMEHLTANNYPGLLDGIMTVCSIPDVWSLISREEVDCPLLEQYFTEASPLLWLDPNDRAAVTGTPQDIACAQWGAIDSKGGGGWFFNPQDGCTVDNIELWKAEPDWVYDPQANPDGVRCTVQDWQSQVFGDRVSPRWGEIEKQIDRGFANWVYDNAGIEYGLIALLREEISPEQFVDLNTKVGGRDIDYNWIPQRTEAAIEGLHHLYRSGRVNDGRQLDRIPIMDVRAYIYDVEGHRSVHGEMTAARLVAANGHAENLVQWVNPSAFALDPEMMEAAFLTLDEWVAGIDADPSGDPIETKVVRNRPPQAKDSCWVAGTPDACGSSMPHTSNPNMQAGGPLTADVFKCQLKPIDWDDYGSVTFTQDQKQQLQATFPDGVCDWGRPGVGSEPPQDVWLTFADAIGGRPLGPAPRSIPIQPDEDDRAAEEPPADPTGPAAAPLPATGSSAVATGLALLWLAVCFRAWTRPRHAASSSRH